MTDLITAAQACELLGVSRSTLHRMTRQVPYPFDLVRPTPRIIRFKRDQVERYRLARTASSPAQEARLLDGRRR